MANVTAQDVINAAKMIGKTIPADQVTNANNALAGIDQAAIQAEEESKLVYEIWDKVSPINGVPADYFLTQRQDVDPNSEIYLIKDATTGNVIYFQPHEPGTSGYVRMDKTKVATVAAKHKLDVATTKANARIIEMALAKIK